MMKKTNLEKNVEHYKAEGVKLTGMKQFNLMSNSTFLYKKAKSNLLGESCTVYQMSLIIRSFSIHHFNCQLKELQNLCHGKK